MCVCACSVCEVVCVPNVSVCVLSKCEDKKNIYVYMCVLSKPYCYHTMEYLQYTFQNAILQCVHLL